LNTWTFSKNEKLLYIWIKIDRNMIDNKCYSNFKSFVFVLRSSISYLPTTSLNRDPNRAQIKETDRLCIIHNQARSCTDATSIVFGDFSKNRDITCDPVAEKKGLTLYSAVIWKKNFRGYQQGKTKSFFIYIVEGLESCRAILTN
jgi:hypothetical protein